MGIRSELPQLDPARSSHRLEQNGYIYDSSGKRVLAVLRGSEARVLIDSERHRARDEAGDRRDRGPPVLRAPRRRHPRDPPRGLAGRPQQQGRPGRLDDHAAVRQEHLREEQPHDQPEAEGGRARLAARAGLAEGQDPDRLPEHDLLRERRLRDRASLTCVFRSRRVLADAGRGGAPRRHPVGPEPLQPGHQPEDDAPPAARGAPGDARPARHHLQRVSPREPYAAPEARRRPSPRHARAGAVLRRLREAAAGRPLRVGEGIRRRA